MAVEVLPKVSALSAKEPTAVLSSASVRASPASPPKMVLRIPVVTAVPATYPTTVLKVSVSAPTLKSPNALLPMATFLFP